MSCILLSLPAIAGAQVEIPAEYVSVGDYSGTPNERINAAVAAAQATAHKTVYFPNGTYALRSGLNLQQGPDTTIHLIGESRNGVFIIPDIPYLEANYNGGDWRNGGARLAHMINLSRTTDFIIFNSVDVSIQNMTIDMRHPGLVGVSPATYNVVGHGVRIGTGWTTGQFLVNHVTIRNVGSYGVGIQDRDGHPKSNVTLSNIHIERAGSDGIDTKEAIDPVTGDGNRNLVIRNVSINEVGFFDSGATPAIDLRYRDVTIENANIVSKSNQGINFRPWDNGPGTGVAGATVSNIYIRGTGTGIRIDANDTVPTPHENIAISDFRIQGQKSADIDILRNSYSGHAISDGFVDPAFGGNAVKANGKAVVTNVSASRWDPALTPTTDTTAESNVSLAGQTFSPAWEGMVGSEKVSLNPMAPSVAPFEFDITNTGVMQLDYDGVYNEMDKLIVKGTLHLDGQLRINRIGGTPTSGAIFQVFEADAITGSFDSISLPTIAGFTWNTDDLATNGTIQLLDPAGANPVINSLSPANSSIYVPVDANLVMTFSENVVAGSGLVTLRRAFDDHIVQTFDVSDSAQVVIAGNQVTLDPAEDLEVRTTYYVTVDPTAFDDLQGDSFVGFNSATDWTFTTFNDRPIVPVNTGSWVRASQLGNLLVSFSFNAGAEAEMLMVAVSTERSGETIPSLTYDGHTLTPAVEQVQAGIWSLDLIEAGYSGGAADLVIDFTGVNVVNGVAIGAVSVRASGRAIELYTTATGTASVDLESTRGDAFVLASFNANGGGSPSVDSPLTTIYASGSIGSAQGAAGFDTDVAAGTLPINWTTSNKRRVTAAAFVVANSFANWGVDNDLGDASELADDPDADRLPNGLEAWFGSNPGEFSSGIASFALAGNDTTFTHPVSPVMPDDIEGFYEWSMNLVDWYACDGIDGPPTGETASASSQVDAGVATVTISPSASVSQLFVRAAVRPVE